jgi:hypothetical protein
VVPEWGNVKALCKTAECAAIPASCENLQFSCCNGYWQRLAAGLDTWAGAALCATLTTKESCCNTQIGAGYYNFTCSTDGKILEAQYYNKTINFCGAPPGSDWDKYCKLNQGCPATLNPTWAGASCTGWTGMPTGDPWIDPDPTSGGIHGFPAAKPISVTTGTGGGETTSKTGFDRIGSDRDGTVRDSRGGRE